MAAWLVCVNSARSMVRCGGAFDCRMFRRKLYAVLYCMVLSCRVLSSLRDALGDFQRNGIEQKSTATEHRAVLRGIKYMGIKPFPRRKRSTHAPMQTHSWAGTWLARLSFGCL